MITKETQYRIYAGTKKNDYTGWTEVELEDQPGVKYWTLDMGGGYFLDRVTKETKKLLGKKVTKVNNLRYDRTLEDPDSEYTDLDMGVLYNVEIMIAKDTLKFKSKGESFVLVSREQADWSRFPEAPVFEEERMEDNFSSFYH